MFTPPVRTFAHGATCKWLDWIRTSEALLTVKFPVPRLPSGSFLRSYKFSYPLVIQCAQDATMITCWNQASTLQRMLVRIVTKTNPRSLQVDRSDQDPGLTLSRWRMWREAERREPRVPPTNSHQSQYICNVTVLIHPWVITLHPPGRSHNTISQFNNPRNSNMEGALH